MDGLIHSQIESVILPEKQKSVVLLVEGFHIAGFVTLKCNMFRGLTIRPIAFATNAIES